MIKNKQKCEDGRSNIIETDYQTITTIWPLNLFIVLLPIFFKNSRSLIVYTLPQIFFLIHQILFSIFSV
jgi:hypothetical protein